MKKITLAFIAILISCFTFAQVEIRGSVSRINKCEFTDSSGYKILKTTYPMQTRIRLNDDEFVIYGDYRLRFKLTDKMVDSSDNQLVVHYLSNAYNKLWMIAARECDGGKIVIGIFPMDGRTKFTEYVVPKPREAKQ